MKLSNLRLESTNDGWMRMVVDVDCSFTKNRYLWVAVPNEYSEWLACDVYDCFLVAALYPAMYYNEDIVVDGFVSPRLLYNVKNYIQHAIYAYRPSNMHFVDVLVGGTKVATQNQKRVATGFSAGVDAFCTVIDRYENEENEERRIDTFAFFNVGSHGGGREGSREKFINRYNLVKGFTEEKQIPFYLLDSNLYDFYQDSWEYDAGTLTRGFGCLACQRVIRYYYLSGEFSYREHMEDHFNRYECNIDEMTELYLPYLLSTENMEIIFEGGQYSRMQKIKKVSAYAPSYKYLNVCVDPWISTTKAENCSHCFKCVRTMKSLDVLGVLDLYKDVFDIEWYKKNRKKIWRQYVLYAEKWDPLRAGLIQYAKQVNYPYFPSKVGAFFCLIPEIIKILLKKMMGKE